MLDARRDACLKRLEACRDTCFKIRLKDCLVSHLDVWRPVGELLGDLAECLSECPYGYRETSMNGLLDVCL